MQSIHLYHLGQGFILVDLTSWFDLVLVMFRVRMLSFRLTAGKETHGRPTWTGPVIISLTQPSNSSSSPSIDLAGPDATPLSFFPRSTNHHRGALQAYRPRVADECWLREPSSDEGPSGGMLARSSSDKGHGGGGSTGMRSLAVVACSPSTGTASSSVGAPAICPRQAPQRQQPYFFDFSMQIFSKLSFYFFRICSPKFFSKFGPTFSSDFLIIFCFVFWQNLCAYIFLRTFTKIFLSNFFCFKLFQKFYSEQFFNFSFQSFWQNLCAHMFFLQIFPKFLVQTFLIFCFKLFYYLFQTLSLIFFSEFLL